MPLAAPDLVEERVTRVVEVASEFRVPVELEALLRLMPPEGPATATDLAAWIRAHPASSRLAGSGAVAPRAPDAPPSPGRRLRADEYWRRAESLFNSAFPAADDWLRFAGVTGSTAYGDPDLGDDCDLMAVVRHGTVWLFLAYAFFRLRGRHRSTLTAEDPRWCLNYVLDERAAAKDYSRPRGFLFAREALLVRPVRGGDYYRALLSSAEWLRDEAPRLYASWDLDLGRQSPEKAEISLLARGANVVAFLILGAYLQAKGLWRNHQLRTSGREDEAFRTITRLGRMALATRKFDRLTARMGPASRSAP